ncbi:hypothetical protein NE237_019063 [Protea cynaroides]|uniref:Uncharacterized protein n=1 Tax=Protea cynaroides TaxID=273540 RepID=A0A9Q0QPR3_9MAGN|nr:hypothetical protein NE237_019063 [Protea cynaroides]
MANNLLEIRNVRVVGINDSAVVLAHGFGINYVGSVNPDYFDFRRYSSLEPYVDDLLNILDALSIEKFAFVSHSISAMIGNLASIRCSDLFTKLVLIGASPRFLDDRDYHGGFERGEVSRVFTAMEANYEAWVSGYAPLVVGADVPTTVKEFMRTLFNMRLDISLFVSGTVFESYLRGVLGMVRVPCCIIQSATDMLMLVSVAMYLKNYLDDRNTVKILNTEGHFPHPSAPTLLVQNLWRALLNSR